MRPLALLLAMVPGWAMAHPVDEVVLGAYLTLAPGAVHLELDIAPGSEVVGALLPAMDPDNDHQVTQAEIRSFAQTVLDQITLTLDGVPGNWALEEVSLPDYARLLSGNDLVKINAVAVRPDTVGEHEFSYLNTYHPAKTLQMANVFLQPGGGWQFLVRGQDRSDDGGRLTVTFTTSQR